MTYIKPFAEISIEDSPKFGGKTASLGELLRAGIPVPDGFGISIEAHREFADKDFSSSFKESLTKAYKDLNVKYVAVRSSAVAEDSSDASWAGQLESYLNTTEAKLTSRIRKCWESIKSDQAMDYARDKRLSSDDLLVGVAVQAMLVPESAGVMFTANPVTGDKRQIMIEGSYGLGEMVVQGAVTPDNFVVDKEHQEVVNFNIAIKEKMMVHRKGKNQIIPIPDNKTDRAVLREGQILELASLGQRIEEHYGSPMDIEWAFLNDTFYIVQARPITTL